jgi:hypothetical protein
MIVGEPNLATDLYFTTTQGDITYRVGDDANLLEAIQFEYLPDNADVSFRYSLVAPAPTFVTLVAQAAGASRINVETTAPSDTGIYEVNFKITDTISSLSIIQTFTVTISCLQSIDAPSLDPTNYYINDGIKTLTIPAYVISPAECPYELVVTSVTVAPGFDLPASIVWTEGTDISIEETVP